MTVEKLAALSGAAIARKFATGEADPVALTEFLLERCKSPEAENVFIRLTENRARQQAQAAAERYRSGAPLSPLDGVPVILKDLLDTAGDITTAASSLRLDAAPATKDAESVAALDDAGMVFLGKTNLTEYAFSGLGLNPHFGTPANPHDKSTPRVPGGSSSGSAVAVAAGLAPCAIGTDTGGSVRVPSAFNGLVGYKTSEGRIGKDGLLPLSRTLDTIGPMARNVTDCLLLDQAMRGISAPLPQTAALNALQIFVPETIVLDDLDEAVSANFERLFDRLGQAGAQITRGPCPLFTAIAELTPKHGIIPAAEAYAEFHDILESDDSARIDRRVVSRMMRGKEMSARDILTLFNTRIEMQSELKAFLDGRMILMPTVAHVAPAIAPLEADDDAFYAANLKTLRNTFFGNFLNLPGVALPNGTDSNGLPTSALISSIAEEEETMLSAALALEALLSPSH